VEDIARSRSRVDETKQARLEAFNELITCCEQEAAETAEALKHARGLVPEKLQAGMDGLDDRYTKLTAERDRLIADLEAGVFRTTPSQCEGEGWEGDDSVFTTDCATGNRPLSRSIDCRTVYGMITRDLQSGMCRSARIPQSDFRNTDQRVIMNYSSRLSAFCDRVIEASWLAALILAPLFFNVYSSRVFEPDKITIVRSLALVMVGAWIIKWLEERRQNGERPDRVTWRTPLMLPTLLFVIIYVISSALSIVPRVSILGSYQRLQGLYSMLSYIVIFWMIVMNLRRREQLDRFVTVVVMTSLPIAFYGLIQHANKDPLPWGGDVTDRVASNMGNPIFVAAYLIMAFFLTMGRLIESFRVILTEKESRISDILRASVYLFVGALQLIAFGFADSRGPLLGWLPGMFIFGLVGLLLLRVSLHSSATKAAIGDQANSDQPVEEQYPIKPLDILKALGMALISIAAAGVGAGLMYVLFPPPQMKITLLIMGALLGGLVPLLAAAGIRRTSARWLWASWILFAAVGAAGLFLINFSDYPAVVQARQSGTFGRLASLLESEGGTGKVRSLIWEGAVKLVLPHAPLQFPDGSQDNLNFLRPIIGYGPESMYVAYNRFYPPDLAHYEARNASPDRSHNETWDSFVNTGAIGFVLEQFLFLSVFFYALKFIGWIPNRRAAFTLSGLMVAGGIAGALALGIVIHPNFMGAGWPAGVTAGLVLYVITFALFHFKISRGVYILIAALLIAIIDLAIFGATFTSTRRALELSSATVGGAILFFLIYLMGRYAFDSTAGQPIEMSGHLFTLVALFGAILAHYLEISLAGIAIASTRTYFWAYAGLLVVLGLHWVPTEEAEPRSVPAPTPVAPIEPTISNKKKSRRVAAAAAARQQSKRDNYSNRSLWLGPVLALALMGALIMGTLGYEFINSAPGTQVHGAIELIWNSLTTRPYSNNEVSYGALLMFLVTWLFGGLLTLTELRRRNVISARDIWVATGVYYGVSIAVAGFYWMLQAWQIMGFSSLVPQTQIRTLSDLAQRAASLVTFADAISNLLTMFYVFIAIIVFSVAAVLMLEVRGRLTNWVREWSLAAAIPVGLVVLIGVALTNLNPVRADIIYKQADAMQKSGQADIAIAHFKRAIQLNPTEDFYYLWMGAAFLAKADTQQQSHSLLGTTTTMDAVMNLSFENTYQLNQNDALVAAQAVLLTARALNPLNTDHSANLARLHRRWADLKASDPVARQSELEQSSKYYQEATSLSPNNAQLWNEWSLVSLAMSDLAKQTGDTAKADTYFADAQTKLAHSLELDQQYDQTYLYLAQVAQVQNKPAEALQDLELALKWNPGNLDAWNGAVQQLLQTQNYTEAEKLSVAFLEKNSNSLPVMRALARYIYYPENRLTEALALMQQVLQLGANDTTNHWDDLRVTAILLTQMGRVQEALPLAQQALAAAPQDQKASVQQIVDQLQAQLGVSSQPTGTLPFQPPKP
jgi:tetratricopeptide (TPR) repeat protein